MHNSRLLPGLKQTCTSKENSFYTQQPQCAKTTLEDANASLPCLNNLIFFALKFTMCDCWVRETGYSTGMREHQIALANRDLQLTITIKRTQIYCKNPTVLLSAKTRAGTKNFSPRYEFKRF